MAKTITDLFKERQKVPRKTELYGLSGTVFIESRGLINPGRAAALLVSSPVPAADLIGGQINGFMGGNSNRPDDTIFKNKTFFSKPITLLAVTQGLLRDAVKADTPYYIKSAPFPGNILKNIIGAINNPAAFVSMGAMALNAFGSKSGFKRLKDLLKRKGDTNGYGSRFGTKTRGESTVNGQGIVNNSNNYTIYEINNNKYSKRQEYVRKKGTDPLGGLGLSQVVAREKTTVNAGVSLYDVINDSVLKTLTFDTADGDVNETIKKVSKSNENIDYTGYTYIAIKIHGKNKTILLPGTISGLSEEFAPEVSSFKYIGSPFNLYKYGGVERTIRFSFKAYALEPSHDTALRFNLDQLRKLVYPDENISVVSYANNTAYSPLFFSPNLIELTIKGLYKNLFGIVDTLSISLDDNIPWASADFINSKGEDTTMQRPVAYDISFGMKVIERPSVTKDKGGKAKYNFDKSDAEENKYVNYFTGYSIFEKSEKPDDIDMWKNASQEAKDNYK